MHISNTTFLEMTSSASSAMVEITVQDPATHHERPFLCALGPLRTHMRYFEPLIQRQINEAKVSPPPESSSSLAVAFTLRARCEHATFQWLINWISGKAPQITNSNVVSICLSSSFLQMQELSDNALMYLSAHLKEIVSSSFDLTNLPTHLVLRLSHMVRDVDLAAALLRLHEERSANHPNRAFVASLLQHYVCHKVGVADGADVSSQTDAAAKASSDINGGAWPPAGLPATHSGQLTLPLTCGLRWCRLCATLFDEGELDRLGRTSQLSGPECPAQSGPTSHTGDKAHHASIAGRRWCVGPRGEVFTTHAAARHATPVILEAPPALKGSEVSASTLAAEAASPFTAELERWAWRIIGAIRYVGCRRCFHLVSLLDVSKHRCSELPKKFSFPDNVAEDVKYLFLWFDYCAEHNVYEREGGLTPMRYSGPAHVLAEEVVEVPTFNSTPEPVSRGAAATTASAAESRNGVRATGLEGTGALAVGSSGGSSSTALASPHSSDICLWATMPFYVKEAMSENVVDIDILNYVERQHRFGSEAQQHRASAAQNYSAMRLSISPVVAGTARGHAGGPLASSSSSPRPLSSIGGPSSGGTASRFRANNSVGARGSRSRADTHTSPYGSLSSTHR
ncbi:conserved hypothetical protein [Leishmania major strain Friedlin]|uniref:SANT and BTB domain-containing protein n=1 Tax=Leishmania major TaxID=5664 RepID=Q4Q8A2_LEIMA|nr:conserved hypothetical protein [Leishmania major strain Friedlin]CAG9577273.1 Domain_of_unknown_function_(DUF3342)_-_putative [Leishmania major strain Friedlin]CAJ05500.1 conserved hypothetical protein [Leishmania major strain Friedlin]|eukprot:XP_001684446.1 conserved hypothetical protein [Leishmania major strain Friedlin]